MCIYIYMYIYVYIHNYTQHAVFLHVPSTSKTLDQRITSAQALGLFWWLLLEAPGGRAHVKRQNIPETRT